MSDLPSDFINSLKHISGFDERSFIKAHQSPSPTAIRINPFKRTLLKFEFTGKVPWASDAFYIKERPVFTADPLFHAGCYYVQEASSMFIEFALKQVVNFDKEIFALDVCAAPGGKSTILSSLINSKSVLVANEVVKNRAEVLAYNLAKWGNCNHVVTSSETTSFSSINSLFDVVLVDAPCSGSGLFRKQEDAIGEWSLEAVAHCAERQRTILENISPSIKQNGHLIYSTCSYSASENEEIVKWMVEEHGYEVINLKLDEHWGIETSGLGYRFYPYKLQGEGFFCCVLRKSDNTIGESRLVKKNSFKEASRAELDLIANFIELDYDHKVINHNNVFKILNNNTLLLINAFKNSLYFKEVGTPIGEIKHEELIPHHYLALSNRIKKLTHDVELSDNEAIKYLKKEYFTIPNLSKGLKRFTSKGFGLGWGKNLGTRINNYLPTNLQVFNKSLEALK